MRSRVADLGGFGGASTPLRADLWPQNWFSKARNLAHGVVGAACRAWSDKWPRRPPTPSTPPRPNSRASNLSHQMSMDNFHLRIAPLRERANECAQPGIHNYPYNVQRQESTLTRTCWTYVCGPSREHAGNGRWLALHGTNTGCIGIWQTRHRAAQSGTQPGLDVTARYGAAQQAGWHGTHGMAREQPETGA